MTTVLVQIPNSSYEVVIERGALDKVGARLAALTDSRHVALVSDERVAEWYGIVVDASLAREGFRVDSFTVAPGETSKRWSVAGELLEALANTGLDRGAVVVALGGGVVGDLAGFVSAAYMRGIDFYQVPTSLLAMVDSSVGGKTGVDLAAGKNLAGAFKQPLGVLVDPDVLGTLPEPEWLSGLAEIAKSAVLEGEDFMGWLESQAIEIRSHERDAVLEAVRRSVALKASVVSLDEKEGGPREGLNYGHTFGHALEKVLGYGTLTHGAAVAEGMRFASRVAVECGSASKAFVKRQDRLLDALGLSALEVSAEPGLLLEAMRNDKKARGGTIRFVLPSAPGEWSCVAVPDTTIAEHLEAWAATKGGE